MLRSWSCGFIIRFISRVGLGIILCCWCFLSIMVCNCFVHACRNFLKNIEAYVDIMFNLRLVLLDIIHDFGTNVNSFPGSCHEFLNVEVKFHELSGILHGWHLNLNLCIVVS